jgi:outer membrane protein assembly factor BamB
MKTTTASLVTLTCFAFVSNVSGQEVFVSNKLEKVWESTEGLNVDESSHYNVADKTIYVSNIVGHPKSKDGVGFISKLDDKGKILVKEWCTGLSAPKGIDCTVDKLYVTDIDRVVAIDLKTGKILKEYRNAKSKGLNDVSVAADGRVYISDSGGNCIFYVGNDSLEVFLESADLKSMNGILAKGNLLYMGANGNFISIDQKTKEIKMLAENVGYLDGIEQVAEGKFVTSNFKGMVQLIEVGKGVEKLIDSTPANINAADLGYIESQKILLVPTFNNNKVIAYKLKL